MIAKKNVERIITFDIHYYSVGYSLFLRRILLTR